MLSQGQRLLDFREAASVETVYALVHEYKRKAS